MSARLHLTPEARDAEYVRAVRVTPDPQEQRAVVRVEVAAPDGCVVAVHVSGPENGEVGRAMAPVWGGVAQAVFAIASPRLWSPDHPVLYVAEASLGGDPVQVRFGMRWVERRDGLILLNGEPLYIRGAIDRAFRPEPLERAPSLAAIEQEIRLAKGMGFNLLYKHLEPEDLRYLDACDRLGMLVWAEPPSFVSHSPQACDRLEQGLGALIERHGNHPSLIGWSLYDDAGAIRRDGTDEARVAELFDRVKALDPTRLLCDHPGGAHVKSDLNDWPRYVVAPDLASEWRSELAGFLERPETNFVPGRQVGGVPALVSAFEVWGLPTFSRDGSRARWFEERQAGHGNGAIPAERRFERYGLDRVFGSLDELARACQVRLWRSFKATSEEMRRRPDLAGYVASFTGIEREADGWPDGNRSPESGCEEFARFNGAVVVMAELPRHNLWSQDSLEGRFWVSNHTADAYEGTIRWSVPGHEGLSGEQRVRIRPFASEVVGEPLRLTVPEVRDSSRASLAFSLEREGREVARNVEELTFTSSDTVWLDDVGPVHLVGEAVRLAGHFKAAGARLVEIPSPETLVLTSTLDALTRAHLEAGGRALFVFEHGEGRREEGGIPFRRLPRGGSRERASSIFYMRQGLYSDLLVGGMLGWECEDLFPHHVVPLGEYRHDDGGIALPGHPGGLDPAGVLAGYFEGPIDRFGAVILRIPYLQGELVVTTMRLIEGYGGQPIGTLLLHRLMALAARRGPGT